MLSLQAILEICHYHKIGSVQVTDKLQQSMLHPQCFYQGGLILNTDELLAVVSEREGQEEMHMGIFHLIHRQQLSPKHGRYLFKFRNCDIQLMEMLIFKRYVELAVEPLSAAYPKSRINDCNILQLRTNGPSLP